MIAVQLIVGRNEEPFLPYAIESVAWADYFTVVNTAPGSEWGEKNKQIVFDEINANKLRYTELIPDKNECFSFADARNTCLEMTDEHDHVLILDADDIHYPQWEARCKDAIASGADSITAYFYHLMVYKNLYQYIQAREILYKNYPSTHWECGVHEQIRTPRMYPVLSDYHYMHYGYIKPQRDVFRRWKFYTDIEGMFDFYKGRDGDTILDDRVEVSIPVPIEHPIYVQKFLEHYPSYA